MLRPAALLCLLLLGLPTWAGEEESSGRAGDALHLNFAQRPAWIDRVGQSVVVKLEEKSDVNVIKTITSLDKSTSNRRYEIRLKDTWDEQFTLVCTLDGVLISETRHRVPLRVAPQAVRDAADKWAPGAKWNATASAETLRGAATVYSVGGELLEKEIRADIDESGTLVKASKLPAMVAQPEPKKGDLKREMESGVKPGDLPMAVRTDFRQRYKDARILRYRTRPESWIGSHLAIDGADATLFEITANDPLNEKFKVAYRKDGKLYEAEDHAVGFDVLPDAVKDAAKKWAPDADFATRARTQMEAGKPQLFTVNAKQNKKKLEATFNEFGAIVEADKVPDKK